GARFEDSVVRSVCAPWGVGLVPAAPSLSGRLLPGCPRPISWREALAPPLFPPPATRGGGDVGDFLSAVRTLARRRPAQDPDTKKLWRLVFQVENLSALTRSHRALVPLVDEILSQSVGPYRNVLEERHDELTDPAAIPEAVRLAERLAAAIAAEQEIVIA